MWIGKGRFIVEADAVAALLIYVKIEGDTRLLKRAREHQGVFDSHRFVFPRVPHETRRSGFLHLQFVREKLDKFGIGICAEEI